MRPMHLRDYSCKSLLLGFQEILLAAITAEEWFAGPANQAMRFGNFPAWAEDLAEGIRCHMTCEKVCVC